jgi:hypothetical protein
MCVCVCVFVCTCVFVCVCVCVSTCVCCGDEMGSRRREFGPPHQSPAVGANSHSCICCSPSVQSVSEPPFVPGAPRAPHAAAAGPATAARTTPGPPERANPPPGFLFTPLHNCPLILLIRFLPATTPLPRNPHPLPSPPYNPHNPTPHISNSHPPRRTCCPALP